MQINQLRRLPFSELMTHTIFWLSYLWLTSGNFIYVIDMQNIDADLHNTKGSILTSLLNVLSFYWFYCFVIPKFFKHSRLKFYVIALISIFALVEIDNVLLAMINSQDSNYSHGMIYRLNVCYQLFWAVCALLIQRFFTNKKLKINNKEREIQHTKTELAFLKQQIHPHFLFNVLNSLYSSSYQYGDEKTSDGIGQLADLLRYMLYETQSEKVPIKEELIYLRKYIDLQMLRFSEDVTLEYSENVTSSNLRVAPMLFITLVENAFKHGITPERKNFIEIHISYDEKQITFVVSNPMSPTQKNKEPIGGVGLVNLERRLMLLYPNKHQLTIETSNNTFNAKLVLQ